jgi:hypothetical protein
MSCTISSGRLVNCKDQVGGIKTVYFMNYADISSDITVDGTTKALTDIGAQTVYQYDVQPETASVNVAINSSKENGTTFYDQNIDITLHKLTPEDEDNIRLLSWGRPIIFVLDQNSQVFMFGAENGCALASGQVQTGTGFGDMSGYQLTFNGKEQQAYYQFTAASGANPFGTLSSTVTVTVGT